VNGRPRIAVVGSVNLDIVARTERLPGPGETVSGTSLARHPGGKGANQALAARRLGAEVQQIARVGRDGAAEEALALLRAEGVDLSRCQPVSDAPTGVALIGVADDGENQIIVVPGANGCLRPQDVTAIDADALIVQLEVPVETVMAALEGFEGLVVANLAPARPLPEALFERADIIAVNETEAAFFAETMARHDGLVALTLGADGARLIKTGAPVAAATPPAVPVLDTTGAGDTFVAALTVGLLEGRGHQAALDFACTAAALTCARHGAQPSFPTRSEVDALMAADS
jgi:ribokinase